MANHAYLRVWTRDFSESTMIPEFARFLTTAPVSSLPSAQSDQPGLPAFTELIVQAVDSSESSVAEWDLWRFDVDTVSWKLEPQPLILTMHGRDYEEGLASSAGHFSADLGFEHFFTGHGGLLAPGAASNPFASSDHPVEHTFRQWMATPNNLKEYHAKTRENIQQLFRWVEAVESALPVERSELSSEGEENFEARLDAIAAQR